MLESAEYMCEHPTQRRIIDWISASRIDHYADCITLSIAYELNEDEESVTYAAVTDKNLTKVRIPPSVTVFGRTYQVTAIEENAFSGCRKLKSVTIGSNVTRIGNNAFKNCKSLTKVTIPAKVNKIGTRAFSGCTKLKTITIKSRLLTKAGTGKKAFSGIRKKAVFKLPKKLSASAKKTYKGLLKKAAIPKDARLKWTVK